MEVITDGGIPDGDGGILLTDGAIPDGDGVIILTDGDGAIPDGDGAILLTDGDGVIPDGATTRLITTTPPTTEIIPTENDMRITRAGSTPATYTTTTPFLRVTEGVPRITAGVPSLITSPGEAAAVRIATVATAAVQGREVRGTIPAIAPLQATITRVTITPGVTAGLLPPWAGLHPATGEVQEVCEAAAPEEEACPTGNCRKGKMAPTEYS